MGYALEGFGETSFSSFSILFHEENDFFPSHAPHLAVLLCHKIQENSHSIKNWNLKVYESHNLLLCISWLPYLISIVKEDD